MTAMQPHRRATVGTLLALGLLLVLTASAHARPKVAVTGTTTVGTKLTAKITGGKSRGITWQACAVKPSGRTCPAANLTRLGTKRTYTLTDTTTGAYIRAQAKVRPKKGKTRTVTSPWRGPITTQDNGGGGGGGGGARVGRYYCPPWGGAGISYTLILSSTEYQSRSSTGGYTLVDGASQPGGKVFSYSGGSYADGWINEYYPEGTVHGSAAPMPVPYIRLGLDPSKMSDRGYGWWCAWEHADPTFPPGWRR